MPESGNEARESQQTTEKKYVKNKFPQISLTETLDLPKVLSELGQGEPVRRLAAFDELNRSPDSGPSRTLIRASSTSYGLTEGGTKDTRLSVTNRGYRIVQPSSQADKLQAAHEALFDNEIFINFIESWQDRALPKDEIAVDWLVRNHDLPEKSAQSVWKVLKANIDDFGLTQVVSGKTLVASSETALEHLGDSGTKMATEESTDEPSSNEELSATSEKTTNIPTIQEASDFAIGSAVTPQIHFNIQIQIPENGSPEDYDAIFRSIGTYLLGHKGD